MKPEATNTLFIIKKPLYIIKKPLSMAILMLLTIAAIMFMGCGRKSTWSGITFTRQTEALKVDTKELKPLPAEGFMPDEEQVFDVEVSMDFLTADNPADSSACAAINGYLTGQLLGSPEATTREQAMKDYIERTKKDFISQEYLAVCYDHVMGTAEWGPRGIINYIFKEEYFGGGAHPTTNVIVKRFNTVTGQPVELWDVFVDSCSAPLESLLTRRLMEQQKVRSLDDLHEMGYLDMVDMFVPKNFWMYDDSVTFFFNQYEIAPYALGQTCLTFTYEELKPYLR